VLLWLQVIVDGPSPAENSPYEEGNNRASKREGPPSPSSVKNSSAVPVVSSAYIAGHAQYRAAVMVVIIVNNPFHIFFIRGAREKERGG